MPFCFAASDCASPESASAGAGPVAVMRKLIASIWAPCCSAAKRDGVGRLERRLDLGQALRRERRIRQLHRDLVHLSDEAHIGGALDRDAGRHAAGRELRARFRLQRPQQRLRRARVEAGNEAQRHRAHADGGERRGEEAERRGGAGGGRHDELAHPERARDFGRMRRPGAAEPHHGVAPRVLPALDEIDARGIRHALDDDLVDAPGGLLHRKPERLGDARNRVTRGLHVELHRAAEEEIGVVEAEHEIGVRHRGLRAAAPVAGRPRIGAGGMRADAQQPDLVDRRDRAAAGADLDHVDRRRLDRQARALLEAMLAPGLQHRRHLGAPGLDEAGFRRRAAHVEGDEVLVPRARAEQRRGERAAGGAGFQQAHGKGARGLDRDQPAGRMHEAQMAGEAPRAQLALEPAEIGRHQRLHIGVAAGRDAARIFAELRHHVRGDRDRHVRQHLRDDRGRAALMRGIAIGVEEADRDRLRARLAQRARRAAHRLLVERRDDGAVAVDALRHFEPAASRHQRVGEGEEQVVDVVALLGAGFEHVAEPGRGDQPELRALALDQRIGDERGAVHDFRHVSQRSPHAPR